MPSTEIRERLISGLSQIPEYVPLTPVMGKRPYRTGWQTEEPLSRDKLIQFLRSGDRQWSERNQKFWNAFADGYGFRFGGDFLGVDVDGWNAERIFTDLSCGNIPKTMEWTSGKPGRRGLVYRISSDLQKRLQSISFTHLPIYESSNVQRVESEQLDLRYARCQSVLPPSVHPETRAYTWIYSFADCDIAPAPGWLEEYLLAHCDAVEYELKEREYEQLYRSRTSEDLDLDLIEKALSVIQPRQPGSGNYDEWMRITAALVNTCGEALAESLLDRYSPSIKGTTWNVRYKVQSFARGSGKASRVGIGTLFHIAKQYGFKFPDRGAAGGGRRRPYSSRTHISSESFSVVPLDDPIEKRLRLIEKRRLQFNQYFEDGLKRDFSLSPVIAGIDTQIEYEGYCPTLDLINWDTVCVQGWLGAGKTESIIRSLLPYKNERAVVWSSPLNGLNRQTQERAFLRGFNNVYHYQDNVLENRDRLERDKPGIYFACPDSFKTYAVRNFDWENKFLVIDEFAAIRDSIGNKPEAEEFFDAIRKCCLLIVADAFLSDADIALIRKIRSGSIALYRQKQKKSQVKIKWLEVIGNKGQISFSHENYLDVLQSWITSGVKRIAVAVDSIAYAKTIRNALIDKFDIDRDRVWIACSDTPEENQLFMPRPDQVIRRNKIEILIYTPTAKSGLDVQSPFDRGLLICCGVLAPTDMLQMLGRCRKCPEWWVSAPRKAANPECMTPSLNGKQVKTWAKKIATNFDELQFNAPRNLQGWGLFERLTKEIEKAFNSEYIQQLLNDYFESVEVLKLSSPMRLKKEDWDELDEKNDVSVGAWRKAISMVKNSDARQTLAANLQNGLKLIKEQKQPSTNAQVWDVKLGELYTKYPKIVEKLIAEKDSLESVQFVKILTSRKVEKLKNWVIAVDENRQDLADLFSYLQSRKITYNSNAFRTYQYLQLFQKLSLKELAKLEVDYFAKYRVNEAFLNERSPAVGELWKQFLGSVELQRLFPLVESRQDFWKAIKACMRFLGYESVGGKARVKSAELHPNGHFRGVERYTHSRTENFIGWLIMENSGTAFFQEHFELITEEIRDRLVVERAERQKWKESNSPPMAA